jgi:YHS domain-containing protein
MSVEPSHPEPVGEAIDLVCGMTVDRATAQSKGLISRYADHDYYFCAKGCKLDFEEDPERYLDPSWSPSM